MLYVPPLAPLVAVTHLTHCVLCGRETEWLEHVRMDSIKLLKPVLSRGRVFACHTIGCARCQGGESVPPPGGP